MASDEPDSRNPLAPYYPSEAPSVPGNGRAWFALLLVLVVLFGAVLWVISILTRLLL